MCSAGAAALRAVLLRTVLRVRCCTRDLAASAVLLRAALLRTVLLPHEMMPRDQAPSGFEHFLLRGSDAEAAAEHQFVSVPVTPGDAVIIGGRVVHGSHAAIDGERVAFSPLYEWQA